VDFHAWIVKARNASPDAARKTRLLVSLYGICAILFAFFSTLNAFGKAHACVRDPHAVPTRRVPAVVIHYAAEILIAMQTGVGRIRVDQDVHAGYVQEGRIAAPRRARVQAPAPRQAVRTAMTPETLHIALRSAGKHAQQTCAHPVFLIATSIAEEYAQHVTTNHLTCGHVLAWLSAVRRNVHLPAVHQVVFYPVLQAAPAVLAASVPVLALAQVHHLPQGAPPCSRRRRRRYSTPDA